MKLVSRRSALSAATAGLMVVGGLFVRPLGAVAATGADLRYVCSTVSGVYQATLRASSARARLSAAPGEPLKAGRVTLALTLPEQLVSDVLRPVPDADAPVRAAGVSGPRLSGTLRGPVMISHGGRLAVANWPSFALEADGDRTTGHGRVELTGTRPVPEATFDKPGDAAWIMPNLDLELDGGAQDAGTAPVRVACALRSYGAVLRGTVTGGGSGAAPAGGPAGAATGAAAAPIEDPTCEAMPAPTEPGGGYNDDPSMSLDHPDLPRSPDTPPLSSAGRPICARQAGFANSEKLGSAIPLGTQSRIRMGVNAWSIRPDNYIQQRGYAVALPTTSRATMLGFGFMPTTVAANVVQVPGSASNGNRNANVRADLWSQSGVPTTAVNTIWIRGAAKVLVDGVLVNGTPLDVGDGCASGTTPLRLSSYLGDYQSGANTFTNGGTYTGETEVPAFSGCGVGEDLSPLLTATTSGPGNYVRVDSGKWCTLNPLQPDPSKCPVGTNAEPKTVTVEPGGEVTVTASPFHIRDGQSTGRVISCEAAALTFTLPTGHWQPRFKVAKIKSRKFSGCAYSPGGVPVKVTANPETWAFNVSDELGDSGSIVARIYGVQFSVAVEDQDVNGDGQRETCTLRLGSRERISATGAFFEGFTSMGGEYSDNTLRATGKINNLQSGDCPPDMWTLASDGTLEGSFKFKPGQKFTLSKDPE
ncbi:hypothetical protein OHR68_04585 [Spirillospora sp. NBC_00431]